VDSAKGTCPGHARIWSNESLPQPNFTGRKAELARLRDNLSQPTAAQLGHLGWAERETG